MTEEINATVEPSAAILPNAFSVGSLFGTNGPLTQIFIYGIVSQLLSAAMAPVSQEITNHVWPVDPAAPLSPADAAMAVVRQIMSEDDAAAEALLSGVNRQRFHQMYLLSGDAPAAELLAVALRRGFIDQATYTKGVAQGRLRTEWADLVRKMVVQEPSPLEPLEALLEGQLPESTARELYLKYGGDPESFEWRFNSRGSSPTPLELVEAARRGVIPWDGEGPQSVSYAQGFKEGPWRNKWAPIFRKLAAYYPPPRTITAMHNAGTIDDATAKKYFLAAGVPDDLLDAFMAEGAGGRTSDTKKLAQSTVLALYDDHLIPKGEAETFLQDLGYSKQDADFILAVADFRVHAKWLSLSVGRVHTLYVSYRINRTQTVDALAKLGMAHEDQTVALTTWDLERSVNAKLLTASEIATAYHWAVMSADDALTRLGELGYNDADAWVYLAGHNHGTVGLPPPPPGVHLPPPTTP